MARPRGQSRPTAARSALIFTDCFPTTGNARHGLLASPRARPTLPTTIRSSGRSTRWRRTSPRISISIGCLNWRDEERGGDGEERDQNRSGGAVKRKCAANIGGRRVPAPAAHRGIVDAHPAIDTRTSERKVERAGHGRFRIAGIGRAMARRVEPHCAPGFDRGGTLVERRGGNEEERRKP